MHVGVLGPLTVAVDGTAVEIAAPKQRAVITALALRPGRRVALGELIDAVWGGDGPRTAKASLQSHVSRLRAVIGSDRIRSTGADYSLALDPMAVDVAEFVAAVDASRSLLAEGHPREARQRARRALDLWRSDPVPDLADGAFASAERARLTELRAAAEDLDVEAAVRAGDAPAVVADLDRLVEADPLREHRWVLLVEALYAAGRQADALRTYQRARDHLADELGIDPGPELREIEARVLAQDPTLGAATADASMVASATNPPPDPGPSPAGRELGAFLFTDIEGSTPMWAADTDVMSRAVARHDQMLDEICTRHGGAVFSQAGDSYAVRFGDVSGAVAAAIEAQRGFVAETWPTEADIRVRMGIHVGPAEQRAGSWFGPAVNVAARVMSIGHGGQVLLTGEAHSMQADLDAPVLGAYGLRGVTGQTEIREVRIDPDRRFPPLRVDDADRVDLPTFATTLHGRGDDIAEVTRSLAEHRLVTIVGLGGMGKTRLAVAAAETFLDQTPDGVAFVDLQVVDRPDAVLPSCISALGIRTIGTDLAANLRAYLAPRQVLVVLDNCEHVVDAAADLAARMMHMGPGVHVLATSRERLDVEGEHVLLARALPVGSGSPARALFLDRAGHVDPDFAPDAADLAAIDELTERLDGLPLAIELAAARVNVLAPRDLLDHIDDRFRLLGGGRRRRASRERTLRATLDWSYQLLDPAEQRLLGCLVVFPATFDARAVAAVAEIGELDAVDLLESLHAKSLVAAAGPHDRVRRFRLLETVRAYADDLSADDHAATDHRRALHARHFLDRAAPEPPDSISDYSRTTTMASDVPNLFAAIDTLIDQEHWQAATELVGLAGNFFFELGYDAEGEARCDRLLRNREHLDDDGATVAHHIRGLMHLTRLSMVDAFVDMEASEALGRDPELRALVLAWRPTVLLGSPPALHDREDLNRRVAEARRLLGPGIDRRHSAALTSIDCQDHLLHGEDDDVVRIGTPELVSPCRNTWEMFTACAVALAHVYRGEVERALIVLDAIGPVVTGFDPIPLHRAIAHAEQGRTDRARAELRVIAQRAAQGKLPFLANDAIIGLAHVARAEGDPARARSLLVATRGLGSSPQTMIPGHRLAARLYDGNGFLDALKAAQSDGGTEYSLGDPFDASDMAVADLLRTELAAGAFA